MQKQTKTLQMTTYKTVNEAFKNGTGDVFFTRNNEYVAVSRHAMDNAGFAAMEAQGFKFMTYDETLAVAGAQEVKERQEKQTTTQAPAKKPEFVYISISSPFDELYLEFPDAYGQNL